MGNQYINLSQKKGIPKKMSAWKKQEKKKLAKFPTPKKTGETGPGLRTQTDIWQISV